jgi:hypothetical protein
VAPIRRKSTGAFMPKTKWLLYAESSQQPRRCVFQMHVHLVFVAPYRRKAFDKEAIARLHELFAQICTDFEAELIEREGQRDHAHLLVNFGLAAIGVPICTARSVRRWSPSAALPHCCGAQSLTAVMIAPVFHIQPLREHIYFTKSYDVGNDKSFSAERMSRTPNVGAAAAINVASSVRENGPEYGGCGFS